LPPYTGKKGVKKERTYHALRIPVFEKENGGFDLSQNRRMASFGPQNIICHNCGFFYSHRAVINLFLFYLLLFKLEILKRKKEEYQSY